MTNYWLKQADEKFEIPIPEVPEFPQITIPDFEITAATLELPPITCTTPAIPTEIKVDWGKPPECNLILEKVDLTPRTYNAPGKYCVGTQPTSPSCLKTNTFKGQTEVRYTRNYYRWSTTTPNNWQYDLAINYYDKEMSSLMLANIELKTVPSFMYNKAVDNTLTIALHEPKWNTEQWKMWSFLSNMYPHYSTPLAAPKKGMGLLWAYDYDAQDYAIFPINGLFVQHFGSETDLEGRNVITAQLKFDRMHVKPFELT